MLDADSIYERQRSLSGAAWYGMSTMVLRIAEAEDRKVVGPVLAHSYSFAASDVPMWLERAGHENLHVLEEGGAITGSFIAMPMGQFFGGRSVRTLGVGGVAIPVPHRGKGAATRMMTEALRLARKNKFALSTLFPTTLTVYQRVGYECAGQRLKTTIDLRQQRFTKSRLRTEEHLAPPDEVKALYRKVAKNCPGYLDRGPYVWGRVTAPRGAAKRTFTFHGDRRLEGYVIAIHQMTASGSTSVTIIDAAAVTRAGGEATWRLLSEYQSIATEAVLHGGTEGFLQSLLPERSYKTEWVDSWMVRICDPALAMTSRGYPPISARITLLLADAALPENSGSYTLTVTRGRGTVRRSDGAKGARITERALAALYTGFLSPWELRRLGTLTCSDEEAAVLAMLFSGRAPSMPDAF